MEMLLDRIATICRIYRMKYDADEAPAWPLRLEQAAASWGSANRESGIASEILFIPYIRSNAKLKMHNVIASEILFILYILFQDILSA